MRHRLLHFTSPLHDLFGTQIAVAIGSSRQLSTWEKVNQKLIASCRGCCYNAAIVAAYSHLANHFFRWLKPVNEESSSGSSTLTNKRMKRHYLKVSKCFRMCAVTFLVR